MEWTRPRRASAATERAGMKSRRGLTKMHDLSGGGLPRAQDDVRCCCSTERNARSGGRSCRHAGAAPRANDHRDSPHRIGKVMLYKLDEFIGAQADTRDAPASGALGTTADFASSPRPGCLFCHVCGRKTGLRICRARSDLTKSRQSAQASVREPTDRAALAA